MSRPPTPLPPFTAETAAEKATLAEDAWNSREPARRERDLDEGLHYEPRQARPRPDRRAFRGPEIVMADRIEPGGGKVRAC